MNTKLENPNLPEILLLLAAQQWHQGAWFQPGMLHYNGTHPIKKDKIAKYLKSILNSNLNFLVSNNNAKGRIAKKPTKNLTELNVNGPISSMPVSWAMNVVPQINVQNKALIIEEVFDIKEQACMQNFFQDFP